MVLGTAVAGLALGQGVAGADFGEAEDRGVFASVTIDGATYDGTQVLDSGSTFTMAVDYTAGAVKGGTYIFTVANDAVFTVTATDLENNSVIASADTSVPGQVTIVFEEDWGETTSGSFHMDFQLKNYTESEKTTVTWGVGGNTTSIDVVVRSSGDTFAPTAESYNKSVSPSTFDLGDFYELDSGTVKLKSGTDLKDATVTYTLTATTPYGADFSGGGVPIAIEDVMDDLLILDADSFTCSVVAWDEDGLNEEAPASCSFSPTADGDGFSGTITATVPSTYTVTYTAHFDEGIRAELQSFTDDQGYLPGSFSEVLNNKATFNEGGPGYVAGVTATWNKPGVELVSNDKASAPGSFACATYTDQTVDASGCSGQEIDYTITFSSAFDTPTSVTVADGLPKGMEYVVPLPTTATLVTWDTSTYDANPSTMPSIGVLVTTDDGVSSFTTSLAVPAGPATFTIVYKAKISDAGAFEEALQDSFDALGNGSGTFSTGLTNAVDFGHASVGPGSVSNTVTISGTKTGMTQTNSFDKTVDWTTWQVTDNGAGDIPAALPVVYTLTADLAGTPSTATANVVIEDTLPNNAMTWGAISATGITGVGSLAEYVADDCTIANIGANTNIGTYCVGGTDDRTLLVNVGKDSGTNAVITAKATITGVHGSGSDVGNPAFPEGTKRYAYANTAKFHYGATEPITETQTSHVYVRPIPDEDGWDVPDVFGKTIAGGAGEIAVDPGERAEIPYIFTVGAGQGIDISGSTIIDYIDADVFELPADLADVITSAKYDGVSLTDPETYFEVTQDDGGNLLIAVKDGVTAPFDVADRAFELTITLTTKPFVGKESKTIVNKAVLEGSGEQETYHSTVVGESTSYGDEAELRKRIYDADTGEWVTGIDTAIGPDGTLVGGPFIYRIEFIAHGTYGQGAGAIISAIQDVLPGPVTFLSFIEESDIGSSGFDDAVALADQDDLLGGNLKIVHSDGTVTLDADSGNRFIRGAGDSGRYVAYFVVEVANTTDDVVNTMQGSSATIHPLYPSIGVEKWTVEDGSTGPQYDENGVITNDGYAGDFDDAGNPKSLTSGEAQTIHFTVSNDGTEPLTNVRLTDETWDNTVGSVNMAGFSCTLEGSSFNLAAGELPVGAQLECTATLPGLSPGQYHSDTVTVVAEGVSSGLDTDEDTDDWHGYVKSYAVGDYVWIDADRNGLQDDADVLPGVTVNLRDSGGAIVATTITDEHGRYLFDNLAAGNYQIEFKVPRNYRITGQDTGTDDEIDSDADEVTGRTAVFTLDDDNGNLIPADDYSHGDVAATQGIDPTWDAGVYFQPSSGGGGDPLPTSESRESTTSTSPTTPTTTPGPSTSTVPSVPTVTPSSATNPTRPVPPTNRPPVTVQVENADECADLHEEGFEPGETVTITVTGKNGQYGITAVADEDGTVRFCLQADEPQELFIEILGENQTTVRKVTIGVDGTLPNTGVAVLPMVAIALALLGAGVFAMAFGSRRRDRGGNHA